MAESKIEVTTPDGVMPTYIYWPAETGKLFPLVIFYMDGVAIRPTLFDMARRIAGEGYFVALPDLFYRSGPYEPFNGATVFSDAKERERLMSFIKSVTPTGVMSDTKALLERLEKETTADTKKIATVGYCMGGGMALSAAGTFPDRVRAAASYHGGRLATDAPDSPHLLASKARGRLYIGYSENDNSFPDAQRERLDAALKQSGVDYQIELYKAAHGFTMADLPVYNQAAAETHWQTMFDLFREMLMP